MLIPHPLRSDLASLSVGLYGLEARSLQLHKLKVRISIEHFWKLFNKFCGSERPIFLIDVRRLRHLQARVWLFSERQRRHGVLLCRIILPAFLILKFADFWRSVFVDEAIVGQRDFGPFVWVNCRFSFAVFWHFFLSENSLSKSKLCLATICSNSWYTAYACIQQSLCQIKTCWKIEFSTLCRHIWRLVQYLQRFRRFLWFFSF